MSALGHKRTFAAQKGMSALPPTADIGAAQLNVRWGPKSIFVCGAHHIEAGRPRV